MSAVAKRIVQRLEAMDMTSAELSRRVGVSEATVHNWRTGAGVPSAKKLELVCKVLQCDIRWLVSGDANTKLQVYEQNRNNASLIFPSVASSEAINYDPRVRIKPTQKIRAWRQLTAEMEPEIKRGALLLCEEVRINEVPESRLTLVKISNDIFRLGELFKISDTKWTLEHRKARYGVTEITARKSQIVWMVLEYTHLLG